MIVVAVKTMSSSMPGRGCKRLTQQISLRLVRKLMEPFLMVVVIARPSVTPTTKPRKYPMKRMGLLLLPLAIQMRVRSTMTLTVKLLVNAFILFY